MARKDMDKHHQVNEQGNFRMLFILNLANNRKARKKLPDIPSNLKENVFVWNSDKLSRKSNIVNPREFFLTKNKAQKK